MQSLKVWVLDHIKIFSSQSIIQMSGIPQKYLAQIYYIKEHLAVYF